MPTILAPNARGQGRHPIQAGLSVGAGGAGMWGALRMVGLPIPPGRSPPSIRRRDNFGCARACQSATWNLVSDCWRGGVDEFRQLASFSISITRKRPNQEAPNSGDCSRGGATAPSVAFEDPATHSASRRRGRQKRGAVPRRSTRGWIGAQARTASARPRRVARSSLIRRRQRSQPPPHRDDAKGLHWGPGTQPHRTCTLANLIGPWHGLLSVS